MTEEGIDSCLSCRRIEQHRFVAVPLRPAVPRELRKRKEGTLVSDPSLSFGPRQRRMQ